MIPARWHGGTGNLPAARIVIHATCPGLGYPRASQAGQAASTASYFATTDVVSSAHVVCDVAETVRCLDDDTVAYHAPPNLHSLGVEICGESSYTREQWLSPQVWPAVENAAAQVREWMTTYHLPGMRATAPLPDTGGYVCGHADVSATWHQTDHTDPGPNFPWDAFMPLLSNATPTPTPEVLMPLTVADADLICHRWQALYGARLAQWIGGHANAAYSSGLLRVPTPGALSAAQVEAIVAAHTPDPAKLAEAVTAHLPAQSQLTETEVTAAVIAGLRALANALPNGA